ncbi:MAG: MerR family transcriptional regulator, partial [Candidatus Levybacteria bacterium]|nr:MerR family transcriptional regulator [Candidatus Levybacteria bacterium]
MDNVGHLSSNVQLFSQKYKKMASAFIKNKLFKIQEVANILGVSTKTLRRWDQRGRFVPTRTVGNQRRYTQEQIANYKSHLSPAGEISNSTRKNLASQGETLQAQTASSQPLFDFNSTPKAPRASHALPSVLSNLPSNSFLKRHFLLEYKETFKFNRSEEEKEKSFEPGKMSKFRSINPVKMGFLFAVLVLVFTIAGAAAETKYNIIAGLTEGKEQFAKYIANLPEISFNIRSRALSFAPQEESGQAVLAAATGESNLILNVNIPASFAEPVSIGTATPSASAILDLISEDKGFLAPRMTEVQVNAIEAPAAGLFVYNTDTNHYNMYNGTEWQGVFSSIGDSTAGDAFTETGTNGKALWFNGTSGGKVKVTAGTILGAKDVLTLPDTTGTFITTGNLTSITTVGTVSTGVWNGTVLTVPYGGTGVSTLTGIVLGNGSGVMTGLTASAGIAGAIGDETGTGLMVFGTSPAITTSLTTASTSFDLINTAAATVNFAGAATALSIGATTGTATLNNATTAITGALTANGNVTLGDAITDTITFTGRVAQGSSLIPITATGTNDLGSSTLPWDNVYADNLYAASSGISGYFQRNNQTLSPTNITDDLLLGGISTLSAKIAFINIAGGTPTASISANSGNNATTLTGLGVLGTTNMQTLTLGNSTTGNIVIDSGSNITQLSDATVNLAGGTASRFALTDASKNIVYSAASSVLLNTLTDATGTGVAVFGTSPDITTSLTTGSNTFSLVNANATTVNFAGAATTLTMGGTTGTASIRNTTVNFPNATAIGIGNTAPLAALDVTGSASLSADLSLRGSGTPHTFNILDNGTLNFQRSPSGDGGLAALPVLYLGSNGNIGIGTTSPSNKITVSGTADFTGNVGVKTSTPTTFDLEVAGNVGPSVGSTYDLGSSSRRWNNVYGVTANFTNLATSQATISGTTTQDFLINSDNATNDTEDASLSFSRGTDNTNSQFKWNSTTKQLTTNSPSFAILPDTTIAYSGTSALMVNQVQAQDIFSASSSGITKFTIANSGDTTTAGDIAVNGGDLTTSATTFNLLNATATTLNIGGAATTVSLGASTGTTTINNALAITGALTANGNVTLGNEITDTLTFTGRVAQDSDLIPIGTTGTNDLGSSALPWDNLYADNIYAPASGTSGYIQRASAA